MRTVILLGAMLIADAISRDELYHTDRSDKFYITVLFVMAAVDAIEFVLWLFLK